jgi:hypothetical protein
VDWDLEFASPRANFQCSEYTSYRCSQSWYPERTLTIGSDSATHIFTNLTETNTNDRDLSKIRCYDASHTYKWMPMISSPRTRVVLRTHVSQYQRSLSGLRRALQHNIAGLEARWCDCSAFQTAFGSQCRRDDE